MTEVWGKRAVAVVLGLALVAVIAGFAVFRGFSDPEIPEGAIAVVDGAPEPIITAEEVAGLALRNARLEGTGLPTVDEPDFERFQDTALGELILARWVLGEADERGIAVSESDVAAARDGFIAGNFEDASQFQRFLELSQLTDAEVAELEEVALISRRVNDVFDPGTPNVEGGYEIPDSVIAAFYEQNMLLYELILDTDPNREPIFATIDQVRELIVNALRPSFSRGLEVAARTDFIDKWQARTFCAPGFTVARCSDPPSPTTGAAPVISSRPIAPSLAGTVSTRPTDQSAQTPFPAPEDPDESRLPFPPFDEVPNITPELTPPYRSTDA